MRRLRKAQNLTLDGLHQQTGVPLSRLRSVEAGDNPPFLSEALRIADALNTTVDALARGAVTTYALGAFRRIADTLPTNTNYKGES